MVALVADHLRPYYEEIEQVAPAELDLLEAVDAFARYYRRSCAAPDALTRLTTALRALFVGLGQGVPLGLAPAADEQYFVDMARALASGMSLLDHGAGPDAS